MQSRIRTELNLERCSGGGSRHRRPGRLAGARRLVKGLRVAARQDAVSRRRNGSTASACSLAGFLQFCFGNSGGDGLMLDGRAYVATGKRRALILLPTGLTFWYRGCDSRVSVDSPKDEQVSVNFYVDEYCTDARDDTTPFLPDYWTIIYFKINFNY
jgi:hypothetical protein